ncbi:hypothetical protein DPMN_145737 [Dreissena polymorpha]|uniref:Uncharacterized protein n=1 Tax=Dreissena polymorpha TaxID=45954 RepID=A0A9D4IXT9_DREPO|nr:hypothetical protein DPMN_145737 [Dreissena polymorpha]
MCAARKQGIISQVQYTSGNQTRRNEEKNEEKDTIRTGQQLTKEANTSAVKPYRKGWASSTSVHHMKSTPDMQLFWVYPGTKEREEQSDNTEISTPHHQSASASRFPNIHEYGRPVGIEGIANACQAPNNYKRAFDEIWKNGLLGNQCNR